MLFRSASHAGLEPEKGINALVELAHQVQRINEFGNPVLGTTVTPTVANAGTTDNTVLGPFFVAGSPERANGSSMLVDPDDGDRVVVRGRITDVDGNPLQGVVLDVWQNNTAGFYACQQPGIQSSENLRGIYRTDENGNYEIQIGRAHV